MRRMHDVALVDLMRRDPGAGLAAVYQRYADRIHDYCRSILRDDADAADAVQDTFLAASARVGQLRDPERLRPWLYAIARNRSYRTIRERERQRPIEDPERAMSATGPVDARAVEADEARALVWEAAGGLEDRDRDVLDLHLRHGLDGAELAAVLGVTPPQANQALHRMRERLNRSVGAALAIRHGRSDCAELRAIVGDAELTPLLRKRVARHLERCDTCEHHRHRGAAIYATIPLLGVPEPVWGAVATVGAGGPGAEAAAAELHWNDTGFPGTSGPAPGPAPPAGPSTPQPVQPPPVGSVPLRRPVGPGGHRPGRRGARLAGAGAVAVVVLVGGFAIGRSLDRSDDDLATAAPLPADDDAGPATPDDTSTSTATTAAAPGSQDPSPPTASTPNDDPPDDPDPTTSSTTSTTVADTDPIPTVTFSADRQAPTMTVTVDCDDGPRITATVVDDVDPAPTGTLELTWPPARTRALAPAPAAPIYEAVLQPGDLVGSGVAVDFTVSGRIVDSAGNISDVADTVRCIFFED